MSADLSVVIPTRNRRPLLQATLHALAAREGGYPSLEVVVVDDGSTDDTQSFLTEASFASLRLKWIAVPPVGPAAARNLGTAEASASRVLLLGDDTIPSPLCLRVHLEVAGGRALAVQGRIDWDPTAPVTRAMRFLAPEGPQFFFRGLEEGGQISYAAVLASNMSAPTSWFRDEPFDERFTIAGFEDTELANRWQMKGYDAEYSARALCWHRHHYETVRPFLDRQHRVGRAARLAVRLHPRLAVRTVLQPTVVGVLIGLRCGLRHPRREALWDLQSRWAFLRGFLGL